MRSKDGSTRGLKIHIAGLDGLPLCGSRLGDCNKITRTQGPDGGWSMVATPTADRTQWQVMLSDMVDCKMCLKIQAKSQNVCSSRDEKEVACECH
jgi:hypothetical protein